MRFAQELKICFAVLGRLAVRCCLEANRECVKDWLWKRAGQRAWIVQYVSFGGGRLISIYLEVEVHRDEKLMCFEAARACG